MMQAYSPSSATQARAILCALQANDRGLLQIELNRVDRSAKPYDAAESERMELLSEIARELQTESEPFASSSVSVYRDLLQHLAAAPLAGAAAAGVTSLASNFQSVPCAAFLQ